MSHVLRRVVSHSRPLIIDEAGYTPLPRDQVHDFFQVIAKRYEKGSFVKPALNICAS